MVCDLALDAIAGLTTRLYQLLDDRHNEVAVLQRSLEPDVILSVVMASRDRRMAGKLVSRSTIARAIPTIKGGRRQGAHGGHYICQNPRKPWNFYMLRSLPSIT